MLRRCVINVTRGCGCQFSRKKRYVTLEWSLNNTTQVTLRMNRICFISLSITHIDDNIIEEVIVDIWRRDLAMLSD